MSESIGMYQCMNCHGPSDGPHWCKNCRENPPSLSEYIATIQPMTADEVFDYVMKKYGLPLADASQVEYSQSYGEDISGRSEASSPGEDNKPD